MRTSLAIECARLTYLWNRLFDAHTRLDSVTLRGIVPGAICVALHEIEEKWIDVWPESDEGKTYVNADYITFMWEKLTFIRWKLRFVDHCDPKFRQDIDETADALTEMMKSSVYTWHVNY